MKIKNVLIIMLCLLVVNSQAQTTTGRIVGTVSAPDGAVIPGALIVATDNQTGKERTVTATGDGTFEIPQLEFGTYTVKITATGYKTFTANEVKIDTELISAQGKPQNIGGYYQPSESATTNAMRPSQTLNTILAKLS